MKDLEAENRMLREQIELLQEKVRALGGSPNEDTLDIYCRLFKFGRQEATLLWLLHKRTFVSHEAIHVCIWGSDPIESMVKAVQVKKHCLKKGLSKYGIEIGVSWGSGYYMTKENKDKLTQLYNNETGVTQ